MLLGIIGPHTATITPIIAWRERLESGDLANESVLSWLVHFDRLQWKQRGPAHIGIL
jgi:hypothetical protein